MIKEKEPELKRIKVNKLIPEFFKNNFIDEIFFPIALLILLDKKYIQIRKINKDDISFMKKRLNELISEQKHNYWWEDIFFICLEQKDVFIKDINGLLWAEVDYIEDYERIKAYLERVNNNG